LQNLEKRRNDVVCTALDRTNVQRHKPNRVIILLTPVRSEADSQDWCKSSDMNTFLLGREDLLSCLGPPQWLFKQVH
jgi:hypothetical protein